MKERRGLKESIFVLKSLVSPFGATHLRPLKGMSVEVENISDDNSPVEDVATMDGKGKVVVPEGGAAKVFISQEGNETFLRIDDYREREGHTLGAKIKGEGVKVDLDGKKRAEFIPGIGYTKYKK